MSDELLPPDRVMVFDAAGNAIASASWDSLVVAIAKQLEPRGTSAAGYYEGAAERALAYALGVREP